MTGRRGSGRPENDGFFSPGSPRVIAHRGLALEAPENTLLAFLKALSIGVTHLETDVHASRDGSAVISHDPDLTRVAGRSGRVRDLSIRDLSRIDLGHGQTFATLAEVLDAFPQARFNIDIKSPDAVQPTVDAILATRSVGRVLVTSFSERRRRAAVRQLPGVVTSASSIQFAASLLSGRLGVSPGMRRMLRGVHAVQVPEQYHGIRIITGETMRLLRTAVQEVHVWTVNDVETMHRLLDLGVDGLVTDRADLALGVIDERFRRLN